MSDRKVVFGTLPNGSTFLTVSRFHAREAIEQLGFKQLLPNPVWEAAMNHSATVHWSGMVLRRVLHPSYTNDLGSYTIVDPLLVAELEAAGGYSVGAPHPSVAKNYAEVVADLEQNW